MKFTFALLRLANSRSMNSKLYNWFLKLSPFLYCFLPLSCLTS